MIEKDNSMAMVQSEVAAAKAAVRLNDANQQHPDSGHSSANYGGGPKQSAAVPAGSPGTGSH